MRGQVGVDLLERDLLGVGLAVEPDELADPLAMPGRAAVLAHDEGEAQRPGERLHLVQAERREGERLIAGEVERPAAVLERGDVAHDQDAADERRCVSAASPNAATRRSVGLAWRYGRLARCDHRTSPIPTANSGQRPWNAVAETRRLRRRGRARTRARRGSTSRLASQRTGASPGSAGNDWPIGARADDPGQHEERRERAADDEEFGAARMSRRCWVMGRPG